MIRRRTSDRATGAAGGFTLIEMAIVITVLGLMVSGGVLAGGAVLAYVRYDVTRENLDRIHFALTAYALGNGRLPCPADASAGTGDEVVQTNCNTAGEDTGVVPWLALGLREDEVRDGWGRYFTYQVEISLANGAVAGSTYSGDGLATPARPFLCTGNEDEVRSAARSLASVISVRTRQNIDVDTDTTLSGYAEPRALNAAYVLISHGPNGFGATVGAGGTVPAPAGWTNSAEWDNATGTETVWTSVPASPASLDATGFDDLVEWRAPWQVFAAMGCRP